MLLHNYTGFLNEMNVGTRWTDDENAEFTDLQSENLLEALGAMKKYRITCWVDCGTLLGLYRDKQLIPGDSDTDTGALVEGFKPDFVDDFGEFLTIPGEKRSAIFFTPKEFLEAYEDESAWVNPKGFKYRMKKKGRYVTFKGKPIMTDIFIYYPNGKDRIYAFGNGYFRSKEDILSQGTKTMTVGGRAFKILNQTEDHLVTMYGKGWESPDPHFKMEDTEIYGGPLSKRDMGGKYTYNFKTGKSKIE
jgi:hypothetical protein